MLNFNHDALRKAYAIDPEKTMKAYTDQVELHGKKLEQAEKQNTMIYDTLSALEQSPDPKTYYPIALQSLKERGVAIPDSFPKEYDAGMVRFKIREHEGMKERLNNAKINLYGQQQNAAQTQAQENIARRDKAVTENEYISKEFELKRQDKLSEIQRRLDQTQDDTEKRQLEAERNMLDAMKVDQTKGQNIRSAEQNAMAHVDKQMQPYKDVRDAMARIRTGARKTDPASDMALSYAFIKLMDTQTGVRNEEQKDLAHKSGLPGKLREWMGAATGTSQLSSTMRKQIFEDRRAHQQSHRDRLRVPSRAVPRDFQEPGLEPEQHHCGLRQPEADTANPRRRTAIDSERRHDGYWHASDAACAVRSSGLPEVARHKARSADESRSGRIPQVQRREGGLVAEGFTYSSADVANALAQVTGGTGLDQWRTRLNLNKLEHDEGLPQGTLSAIMRHESNGDPYATSDRGAGGLFQLMPKTAKAYGADPFDPEQAAPAAAKELGSLYKKYGGDVDKTLAAWNWGQGNLDKQGIDNAPAKTRGFMAKVGSMLSPASAEAAERAPQRAAKSAPPSAASAQHSGFTYTPDDVSAIMQQLGGGTAKSAPPSAPIQTERSLNPLRKPNELTIDIEKESPGYGKPLPTALVQLTPEMDDDEILERLGYDPAEVKKAKLYQPGAFKSRVTDPNGALASVMDSPLGGLLRGVRDPAEGVLQLGVRGLAKTGLYNQSDVQYHEALMKLAEADYQQNIRKGSKVDPATGEATGLFADPSRMVGEGLATATVPMGRATTLARTAGRGALMGGGLAAAQPVLTTDARPGGERDTFWEQKASQIGTGALFGGVLAPALEKGVVPAITKGANWMRGRGVAPEMQRRVDLEQRFGVRLGYQDVVESRIPGQVGQALENVPGTGFGGFRIGQHEDTRRAITRYQDELQTALRKTPWHDLPAVQAAAAKGGRIGTEARALLDEIRAVGNDPHRTIQASSKLNLFQDRLQSERNYSRVDQLAKPLGNMRPTRTTYMINEMIEQAEKDPLPSAEVKREVLGALQRVRSEIVPDSAATTALNRRP